MGSAARDLALALGVFAATTGLAEVLGAVNMGTALAFGQIAFAATILWLLVQAEG